MSMNNTQNFHRVDDIRAQFECGLLRLFIVQDGQRTMLNVFDLPAHQAIAIARACSPCDSIGLAMDTPSLCGGTLPVSDEAA